MKRIPAIAIIIALSNRPLMAIAIVDHGTAALGWASLFHYVATPPLPK
jgi:hypothetical protein